MFPRYDQAVEDYLQGADGGEDRVSWFPFARAQHCRKRTCPPTETGVCSVIAVLSFIMSLSPATASNSSDVPSKRRRTNSIVQISNNSQQDMPQSPAEGSTHPQPSAHIPKRGARACTACRKGKNRCEGEVSSPDGPLYSRPAINTGPTFRAGPARFRIGTLSSVSAKWYTMHL